ncbi:hypothetical protein [Sphingobacterium sp. T2]|uniref:hypothetical protein n=1 Tax=Sphingobacterium sp. T2 TaxID=1590596 RepID=UPI00057BA2B5|nr:hypothetical protein [Sphingobacterium sp. T2]
MKNLNVIILSAALLMSCKESVELVESTLNLGKVEKVAASSSSSDDFFQIRHPSRHSVLHRGKTRWLHEPL